MWIYFALDLDGESNEIYSQCTIGYSIEYNLTNPQTAGLFFFKYGFTF